jgi:hypothetical protein
MLSRIITPEQLKNCKPGEPGKTLELDRVPETRFLWNKNKQIVEHKKANEFNHNEIIVKTWLACCY